MYPYIMCIYIYLPIYICGAIINHTCVGNCGNIPNCQIFGCDQELQGYPKILKHQMEGYPTFRHTYALMS